MNAPTIIILLIIIALFGLALRYVLRHGSCSECEKSCADGSAGSHCGGCTACRDCSEHTHNRE